MKAKLLFLITALIAVANTFSAEAQVPINIVREPTPPGSEVSHRAPAQIPMDCVYYPSLTSIATTFHYDLGSVSVRVENQTTGDNHQVQVNALAGPMILPISGISGRWRIIFILANGVKYSGEFWI